MDKIVGPGNKYVAAAKSYVARDCAIDFQAGPSEILILSDAGQPGVARGGPDRAGRARSRRARGAHHVACAPRAGGRARGGRPDAADAGPAPAAIRDNGGIIVTRTTAEAVALANRMAPEHLVVDEEWQAEAVRCAGAIFIGSHTAQVAGDYAIGSNHVLPTGDAARFRGGLSAADFVRIVSVQRLTSRGLRAIAPTVVALATAEGLVGHARSIQARVS